MKDVTSTSVNPFKEDPPDEAAVKRAAVDAAAVARRKSTPTLEVELFFVL